MGKRGFAAFCAAAGIVLCLAGCSAQGMLETDHDTKKLQLGLIKFNTLSLAGEDGTEYIMAFDAENIDGIQNLAFESAQTHLKLNLTCQLPEDAPETTIVEVYYDGVKIGHGSKNTADNEDEEDAGEVEDGEEESDDGEEEAEDDDEGGNNIVIRVPPPGEQKLLVVRIFDAGISETTYRFMLITGNSEPIVYALSGQTLIDFMFEYLANSAQSGGSYDITLQAGGQDREEESPPRWFTPEAFNNAYNIKIKLQADQHLVITPPDDAGPDGIGAGPLFAIQDGVTLILGENLELRGVDNNYSPLVVVGNGGKLILDGAQIKNNVNTKGIIRGGGVTVFPGGNLVINSGHIINNTSKKGTDNAGGVTVVGYDTATNFVMNGGHISGNSGIGAGGIMLYHNVTGTINGGTIYNNRSLNDEATNMNGFAGGIGVMQSSTLTIEGSVSITSNSGYRTGGIFISTAGQLTLKGGTISGNTSFGEGFGNANNIACMRNLGGVIDNQLHFSNGVAFYDDK